MKKIYGIVLLTIMLAVMLTSVVTSASAVSYKYLCTPFGKDGNGDPIFKASTNDPDFQTGTGFVRFWLYLGTTCDGGSDDESPNQPHIMLVDDGSGYWVGYYTFTGYGDTVVCVKAHFQGGLNDRSEFSECITVDAFSNFAMVFAGCVGIGAYIRRQKKRDYNG